MLKALILFLTPLLSFANCPMTLQGILDENTSGLLEKLQMPNCTEEVLEIGTMCNCANDYSKFKKENSVSVITAFKSEINKKREEDLLRGAKAKIVSMIYDLHYADNMLEMNDEERQKLTLENECNLDTFKLAVQKTCGNNPLINNENLDQMIEEFQNEGLLISSTQNKLKEKGFFDRSKNSCNINDDYLLTLQNYNSLYALVKAKTKRDKEDSFLQNPLGHYLSNTDKKIKVPNFKSIAEVKKFLTENKKDFLESFGNKCKQNFKDAAVVLCSDLTNSKISDDDFLNAAEVTPYMYYEDKGFLEAQEKISNFCQARSEGKDKFSSLNNLLKYSRNEEKIPSKDERKLLKKERQDLFKMSEAMKEDFPQVGYQEIFTRTCNAIQQNRPVTFEKLKKLGCSLQEFEKNFDKNLNLKNDNKRNCPLLVLDYILNTPEEELIEQKVDKELIAFKKESNEKSTSESKGSGLLTSFLSISKPETVAKFKAAGIDTKVDESNSQKVSHNSNARTQVNNVPQQNVMNVQQPTSNRVVQNAPAPSQGQADSYAPQYNQIFPNLAPSEREQIQDIEKEIMRRLGVSNEKNQIERQRSEMYKNYSKELEQLAKEKKRLEASSSTSSKDQELYDKKMQDLIDQMKSENQKLARAKAAQDDNTTAEQAQDLNRNFGGTNSVSPPSVNSLASPSQNSIMNDSTNKALNETVNRERYNELTGKNNRAPAAIENAEQKFALLENGRLVEISSLEELVVQKRSNNEAFIIAFKNSPTMRVEIIPTAQGYTFKPLGSLTNKEYRQFYMEVKMTLENEKQNFHREDLKDKLLNIKN